MCVCIDLLYSLLPISSSYPNSITMGEEVPEILREILCNKKKKNIIFIIFSQQILSSRLLFKIKEIIILVDF